VGTVVEILVACILAFAVVVALATVSARLTRPLWRATPVLAFGYAIIGVALIAWLQFLVSWANPIGGRYFAFGWLFALVLVGGYLRAWRVLRGHRVIVAIAFGLLLVYLGMLYLWVTPQDPYDLAALRFAPDARPFPVDNALPWLMANSIQDGVSTHGFLLEWNGSDRPPLQSGAIITMQTVFGPLGFGAQTLSFAIGVVLQLLWIPALWALLRTLRVNRWVATMALVFTGVTATMLINTVYTWPKLLSAALVIVSLTLLVTVIRRQTRAVVGIPAAGLAFTLAMLCHGAAAFLLPAVAILGIVALVRQGRRVRTVLLTLGVAAVTYLPWVAYQRFADPPGDRLLKWHLAGVTKVDPRSFARTLLDSYGGLTFPQWLSNKFMNFAAVFNPHVFDGLGGAGDDQLGAHRYHEYYNTTGALSLTTFLLLGIAVAVIVALIRRRPVRELPLVKMMLLMLPCILFWCLVIFLPAGTIVHQGSHVWIVVLMGAAFAWVAGGWRWAGPLLILVQAAITAWFYLPYFGQSTLRPLAVVSLAVGIGILVAALLLARRSSQAAVISGTTTRNTRPAAITRKPEIENRAS
jgi:hypothetical protein